MDKVTDKQKELFFETIINMDRHIVKFYKEQLWTDVFSYTLQGIFVIFSGYGAWWVYTHKFFIPIVPYFAVYVGISYGVIKQILDIIHFITNQVQRHKGYKESQTNIAKYEAEQKNKKEVFVNEEGEHGR